MAIDGVDDEKIMTMMMVMQINCSSGVQECITVLWE